MTLTEDIVNEICGAWIKLFPNKNKFIVFENYIREIFENYTREINDVDDFYPFGERTQIDDAELSLSMKSKSFIFDVGWVKDGMGLAFIVNSKTIEMYLCSNGFDCFEPELKFVFKRTFDFDGLFD